MLAPDGRTCARCVPELATEVTVPRTDMTTEVGLLFAEFPWVTASFSAVYQGPNPAG